MTWLDKPISNRTTALLSCIGLGFAAWLLGSRIGMPAYEAIPFAVILATSVGGLADYVANTRK
jgi:hypothetical protein